MAFLLKYRKDVRPLLVLCLVFILARVAFIALMPHTYSKDLYAWLNVVDILKAGGNPYTSTGALNWPPFWMQVLYGCSLISSAISVSLIHAIQAVLIAGEALVLLPCYFILRRFFNIAQPLKVLIAGWALNPVCIFLTCQHCNFDVFAGLWILLFVAALISFQNDDTVAKWLMACFFLGMGVLTKTVPFILTPLLLAGIRKLPLSTIIFGLALLVTPVVIGMSIIFTLAPAGVMNNVVGYRSMPGWYGITGFMDLANNWNLIRWYARITPLFILLAMAVTGWRVYHAGKLPPLRLALTALLLLMALPTFGPGYSPPYIYWFFPLLIVAYCTSLAGIQRFMLAAYVVVALTYITEYAFFDSHGAFLLHFYPSSQMKTLSDWLGNEETQVVVRIPMFAVFVTLFTLLTKRALLLRSAGSSA